MPRVCTVCVHPARLAIDRALLTAETPYRHIAAQYALSTQALVRHKADHLTAAIVEAWQRERADTGAELSGELRGWMARLTKLLDACDDWLTDPDDPSRYDLNPRAHEVMVHYEETITGPGGRPLLTRRKAKLADLLDRAIPAEEGDAGAAVGGRVITLVEHKSADPRRLIIDTSKALESHLRLLGEIAGKLATAGTVNFLISPEWLTLRGRMLAALDGYPEARLALAVALEGDGEDAGAGVLPAEWEMVAG